VVGPVPVGELVPVVGLVAVLGPVAVSLLLALAAQRIGIRHEAVTVVGSAPVTYNFRRSFL
jgi:hypothetical protein